ncbi:MAG: nicotinamidase [Chthoniobacter sp.]|nr:nicotinamidase [Chthoniobacter sp.]
MLQLTQIDALIIVDVQNDFLPGGSLAVPGGNEIIPILNTYIAKFERRGQPIFASRDWHPPDHCSFRDHGGIWPVHCVAGTRGSAFAAALKLPATASVISKGIERNTETYSAFGTNALETALHEEGIRRLFIGGLATDYCVRHTVNDALVRGFEVLLLRDAVRAVDLQRGDGDRACTEMLAHGAVPITIERLAP